MIPQSDEVEVPPGDAVGVRGVGLVAERDATASKGMTQVDWADYVNSAQF